MATATAPSATRLSREKSTHLVTLRARDRGFGPSGPPSVRRRGAAGSAVGSPGSGLGAGAPRSAAVGGLSTHDGPVCGVGGPPVPIVCVSRDVSWRYICVTVPTGQSPSMSGRAPCGTVEEVAPMARRAELLEFAVLGLLHESPMHGYELRKRLNTALGAFRALSYGSLYPALRDLLDPGVDRRGTAGDRRLREPAGPHRLRAHAYRQGTVPGARRPGRAECLGGRRVRRPPGLLRPHDPRGAAAHPRGPAVPARGAARPGPRDLGPQPGAAGRLHRRRCSGTARSRPSARSAGWKN